MNAIRVKKMGKFKAKTNGGQYWEVTFKGNLLGEIGAKEASVVIKGDAVLTYFELGQLQELIWLCRMEYAVLNKL